ncbi:VanW family protein [Candidatus Poriferisodalis sp.]|uniref:VanW family protein n=1 Tax=Candidatus Poriferisodalis sp. TaxID=3101277 RepID=UPI003AF7E188
MHWPTWAPRWSIITAAAILVAAILGTAVLAVTNSADAPDPTVPVATDAPTATSVVMVAPTADAGTPSQVSSDALRLRIAMLAAELASTPIVVRTDAGEVALTVADLGITLEIDASYDAVRELRAASVDVAGSAEEPWTAMSTDPQFSERRFRVDRSQARSTLANATDLGVTATPPAVTVVNDTLAVDLGQPGQVVDADAIVDQVLEGIARSFSRIEIAAELTQSEPLAYTPELQQAVNTAHENYGRSLVVAYGEVTHELTIETVAGWLNLDPNAVPPVITFDDTAVGAYLEEAFAAASAPFAAAAMTVVDGVPRVVASDGNVACCANEVGPLIEQAIIGRIEGPLALPTRPAVSREEQAYLESLGIVELVATFTTRHACCQSRVDNIHRFAELMRAVVVEPGQSLSLNGHVGRRTTEKGFVEGGFIDKGVLVDDIGGGVSQFATTIFNSLILAGMGIDEYQTHSLYLSRYPFGLDPTISYPKPDLKFTNPTPYGVLVWPTYTDTSITVELYSTRNVQVKIGEPEEDMQDFCRRVRTDRTRVFSDGTVKKDTFNARYRPEEGRDCDGTRSVPRQCVDPLLVPPESPEGAETPDGAEGAPGDSELEMVDDGSERADGSIVECPSIECEERPGERDSEVPRYPDDPCLGVDLSTLVPPDESGDDGDGTDGEDDETEPGDGTDGGGDETGEDPVDTSEPDNPDNPDGSVNEQASNNDGNIETGELEES